MHFTEKEITLARQLKEAGLEWNLKEGDWLQGDLDDPEILLINNNDYWITTVTNGFYTQWRGMIVEKLKKHCVWLPLWHQCRKILLEANIELTISDMPRTMETRTANVTLTLWRRHPGEGIKFCQQIVANTDLEAMYRGLLEVITDVEKNEIENCDDHSEED